MSSFCSILLALLATGGGSGLLSQSIYYAANIALTADNPNTVTRKLRFRKSCSSSLKCPTVYPIVRIATLIFADAEKSTVRSVIFFYEIK
jgi:hypothetical protein